MTRALPVTSTTLHIVHMRLTCEQLLLMAGAPIVLETTTPTAVGRAGGSSSDAVGFVLEQLTQAASPTQSGSTG